MKKVMCILICYYFMSLFFTTYAHFEDVYHIQINHRLLNETSRISLNSDNVYVKKKGWGIELVRMVLALKCQLICLRTILVLT